MTDYSGMEPRKQPAPAHLPRSQLLALPQRRDAVCRAQLQLLLKPSCKDGRLRSMASGADRLLSPRKPVDAQKLENLERGDPLTTDDRHVIDGLIAATRIAA
jgi:hypothetical protein